MPEPPMTFWNLDASPPTNVACSSGRLTYTPSVKAA